MQIERASLERTLVMLKALKCSHYLLLGYLGIIGPRAYAVRRVTHVLFATALVSVSGLWETDLFAFYTLTALLSSIVPDVDLKYMHRKLLHNLFVPTLVAVSIYYSFMWLGVNAYHLILSFTSGWLSHILLDMITVKGVHPFYPLVNKRVALKICKSDGLLCNALLSGASLIVIIYSIKTLVTG
ncbi:MAG: metal-dependent hydrolase [Desulfurococcaceae archaeon]